MVYFDTAASYPLLSEVKAALNSAFDVLYANSAASHLPAQEVSEEIEKVRKLIAEDIGAFTSEIVFTSGATESNNIAFKSFLLGREQSKENKHIVTSELEHKCTFSICNYLSTLGYKITFVKPNKDGVIEVKAVKDAIQDDTALVSIMHVNNELGTINPIADIGQVCFDMGVIFHSDAAQSFKKLDIDVDDLNVDMLSFSAHKIGGPKGIGAVYIRDLRKRHLLPVIHGAGQEAGLRGGTIAAPLIVAFGEAIRHFPTYYEDFARLQLKERLISLLKEQKIEFVINGTGKSLAHCISLTLPLTDTSLLIRENLNIFALAQGSACSSQEIEASHVLTSLGLSRALAEKTLRISFSLDATYSDLLALTMAIKTHSRFLTIS